MKYNEQQVEELLDKVSNLLNSYDEADKAYMDKQDADNWNSKYGERLGQYSDKLKVLNGDDFDILEESRKEHKDSYSDLSDDDYVNSLEENIKKVISRVWPEAPEEVKEEVAEQVSEEVEGETIDTDDNTDSDTDTDSDIESSDSTEDVDVEEDPTTAYVTELETYKANMPKRNKKEE